MARRREQAAVMRVIQAAHRNSVVRGRSSQRGRRSNRRGHFVVRNERLPFAPPEDWYEPEEKEIPGYRVIVQPPGAGYRHVVTPKQVRERLRELPYPFVRPLEVIQFSRMTRKKQSFPCYGMQWGATLYLYPIEESLVEVFGSPPRPALYNEAKMYGGRWEEDGRGGWRLIWTEASIRDFYLNNILIHELGHLLDERNSSYNDRERYAEWFAVEYGYRRTGGASSRRPHQRVKRRHHAT
jgi:hypothetical protein